MTIKSSTVYAEVGNTWFRRDKNRKRRARELRPSKIVPTAFNSHADASSRNAAKRARKETR